MNFKKLIGSVVSLCADIAFDEDDKKKSDSSEVHPDEQGDEFNHARMMRGGSEAQKRQANYCYHMFDD